MDPLLEAAIIAILSIVAGVFLGNYSADARYKKVKKIIGAFADQFDSVRDALYDDKVTEEEFRNMFEKARGIWQAIIT